MLAFESKRGVVAIVQRNLVQLYHLTVPAATAVKGHFVLVEAVVVSRAGSTDLFTLKLYLPYAGFALTANVVGDFDEFKDILLLECQRATAV